jgi:hypothetical protein
MITQCKDLIRIVAGLAVTALLGCGVGVGGTGTGEQAGPQDFGAVSASACTAPFAVLVGCAASGGVLSPATPPTASASFVDVASGRQVLAVFEKDSVTVDAVCAKLRFSGSWGVDASASGRFYGAVSGDGGADRQLATLDIGVPGNGDLLITLKDKSGSVVFGPRELKPASAPTLDPSSCP